MENLILTYETVVKFNPKVSTPESYRIKLNGHTVGSITASEWYENKRKYTITLSVKSTDVFEFRWLTLDEEFESVSGAQKFLKKHISTYAKEYDLYMFKK